MRLVVILTMLWLSLGAGGVLAQVAAPATGSAPTLPAPPAPPAPDTVTALHNFYNAKRRLRSRVVLSTLGISAAGIGLVSATAGGRNNFAVLGDLVGFTLLGVPGVGVELLYFGQYSRRNERLAIEDFQAHKLPRHVRKRLEPEYFQAPN